MAKSTIAQALASLQFKFKAKIKEVGTLKQEVKYLQTEIARETDVQAIVIALRKRVDDAEAQALRFSFRAQNARTCADQLQRHLTNALRANTDLKDGVSNWKSLSGIMFVLGVVVGGLSYMAYLAQV